jgi:hypothetical protein
VVVVTTAVRLVCVVVVSVESTSFVKSSVVVEVVITVTAVRVTDETAVVRIVTVSVLL